MRVLLDVSVLGHGNDAPKDRTGIFRAVEQLAFGLSASSDCDLLFTAPHDLDGTLNYLGVHHEFARVPLANQRLKLQEFFDRRLSMLNEQLAGSAGSKPILRVQRKSLYSLNEVSKLIFPSITPRAIAEAEIFHSPFHAFPTQTKRAKHLQRFLTVYDLVPVLFPQFFEETFPSFFENILKSLNRSDWIFCDSLATKNDLCDYLKLDPQRTFVVYLAADPHLFYPCLDTEKARVTRARYGLPESPYILSLGALEPRKNLPSVVRAFVRLVTQQHISDLCLVLTGPRVRQYDDIWDTIKANRQVRDRIILTGYVADEDMAPLYSGALAFVFFSWYEGFGLPPLEAMQCGVPVITSNVSSLPEVVGDAGTMLDPTDEDGLAHAMFALYQDSSLRERMACRSLERAGLFGWDKFTRETIAAYQTALRAGRA